MSSDVVMSSDTLVPSPTPGQPQQLRADARTMPPAIDARELGKAYLMYARPGDRLRQAFEPRLRRALRPLARAVGRDLAERAWFTRHWALRGVNLSVERGETVGIIGRNGSGKSTLLQMICGTLNPTEGSVSVRGRVAALLELGSGFNPEYTGRENVFLNASVLGLSTEETRERLERILAFADIGDYVDQPVKTYSSGMAMRLAFAVIAHVDADVLVIDEALAVGDAAFQQKCLRWLRAFREHGTVLFCGHDVGAVMSLCHNALWLDRGAVRTEGRAKDVAEAYLAAIRAEELGIAIAQPAGSRPESLQKHAPPPAVAPVPSTSDTLARLPQVLDLSAFDPQAESFGTGEGKITQVKLTRHDGTELTLIEGGEPVVVEIEVLAETDLHRPIIGFHVKDRLGQALFGDNTYLSYQDRDILVPAGGRLYARFQFAMPLLRSGEYSVSTALAAGSLEEHVMHHWIHDALAFTVRSPLRNGVMVALPMTRIDLSSSP